MNQIEFRKIGNFYHVFDDDCYILYYLFNYQIKNHKTGFPKVIINRIINVLEEKQISYIVKNEDKCQNFKRKNNYQKYLEKGKTEFEKEQKRQNLIEEVKKLDEAKLKKLYHLIEEFLYE